MTVSSNLRITYIGGPTAVIDFGGLKFITDPTFDAPGGEYTTGPITLRKFKGPALPADSLGKIDVVLLSHDHHSDNLDPAGRSTLALATQVLTTQDGAQRLGGNATGLAPWSSVDLNAPDGRSLRITATPARHGPEGGDRGPVIGFLLQFADESNRAVYISGDTVWYEGVEQVVQRFPVKTALLFMGAARTPEVSPENLTFTAQEAVQFSQASRETKIVPLHFEGWRHYSESRAEIAQTFADAGLAERLIWLEAGQPQAV